VPVRATAPTRPDIPGEKALHPRLALRLRAGLYLMGRAVLTDNCAVLTQCLKLKTPDARVAPVHGKGGLGLIDAAAGAIVFAGSVDDSDS